MLSQLVQEMRVGSHIPYRRSESGWPVPGCPARVVQAEAVLEDTCEGGSVAPGIPLPLR